MPSYAKKINEFLRPTRSGDPLVLDLFSGAGGLSLGFEACGFSTHGVEADADCHQTYSTNLNGTCTHRSIDSLSELPIAPIVIGGPPCQPFSVGGNQRGRTDRRNCIPTFVSAIQRLSPMLFILENVRGLLYKSRSYFESVITELRHLGYQVDWRLLNAAKYGVPQNRERLLVVGHHGGFRFPTPETHLVTAGEALGKSAVSASRRSKFLTESMDAYIARYEAACGLRTPRDLHLDRPARPLTIRNLAGATSDMQRLRLPDGRRRRLSVREAARLQTFPDWYRFHGSESSQFSQIGNAVPPLLARHLAMSVRDYLSAHESI